MSSVPQSNRYAPPAAHVEDVAVEGVELAGRGARLGAAIIDMLIGMVAAWAVSLFTPWAPFSGVGARGFAATMAVNGTIGYLLFILVQSYTLATKGQTIGKLLLNIRIVRSDGERASYGRLVGMRYGITTLIGLIPGVGQLYGLVDSLLIFRESHKCLHDNIADTIVVKA